MKRRAVLLGEPVAWIEGQEFQFRCFRKISGLINGEPSGFTRAFNVTEIIFPPVHGSSASVGEDLGWAILHRDVCMYSATQLIDVLAGIRCDDRDIQLALHGLRRELIQGVASRAPWRAREALDVIIMLDAPTWASLLALIDECPVVHAALPGSRRSPRAISPTEFAFIPQNRQIAAIRGFMASLPSALTC